MIIISCLKPDNCVQMILIRQKFLISHNHVQKKKKKDLLTHIDKKCKYECTMNTIP